MAFLRASSSRILASSSARARSDASLARCACSSARFSASPLARASASALARASACCLALSRAATCAFSRALRSASSFSCCLASALMSFAAAATTRCVDPGSLPGAVKSKSSSPAPPTSSLRVSNTRAKPSLISNFIAFSRVGLSTSAFSMIWAKVDLPSTSFRTFIRSRDTDAVRWFTCVMPLAVLVKTVVLSIRWPGECSCGVMAGGRATASGANSRPAGSARAGKRGRRQ